ncbi:NAD(P)/FAD-dependent oxidoreductase [Streptomyces clavuligerus]|uniref:NAD(P)/FAD-dependent oxidoreductase n=1 Tax=Streptomyces clavuligerus TaxID=1901 RepID=UPI00081089BE|nr:FAD-dependent oxidoreductase [Streptomyces clavuligerus]ANW17081.1 oxidoreductase [Streptomyces clavuligerus]
MDRAVSEREDEGPTAGVVARSVDVLVVGGGPAGLAAGARLAAAGAGRVEVVERERQAGGIPRHCFHGGFGLRDLRRPMDGPAYARRLADDAVAAGARLRTGTTVTGWDGPRTLLITGPQGLERVTAGAVVLATGARERPRAARLVPGTRPAGVYTTGELQQAVNLYGHPVGTRALVVGADPVAYNAVLALRTQGVPVVALVTERPPLPAPLSVPLPALLTRRPVPVLHRTAVAELLGHGRLSGVRLRHRDGRTGVVACDTVVFTGDWVPDHELARRGGIPLDPGTRGPAVDTGYRTAEPSVFAAGNLLRGVERASSAAEEGRAAAERVLAHLAGEPWPGPGVPVRAEDPLLWVAPNRVHPGGPAPLLGRFVLRTSEPRAAARLTVTQDGRLLHRTRLPRPALPGRGLSVRADWLPRVDPDGGAVTVGLTDQ